MNDVFSHYGAPIHVKLCYQRKNNIIYPCPFSLDRKIKDIENVCREQAQLK